VSIRRNFWSFAAPLLLAAMVGTIAAAVNEFASPPGGLQLPGPARDAYAVAPVETGALTYPRNCVDADGVRVTMAKPPQRIISQARSIEEYLYSIVPPESVIAVSAAAYERNSSDVYDYVEKYHPAMSPGVERALHLNPDLVIVSSSGRADFSSLLRSSGVPLYRMNTMFATLDQVADGIRLVGYVTGRDGEARAREEQFRSELNAAFALRPPSGPKPRIVAVSNGIVYGRDTLFNDIVEKLGGINVAAEAGLQGYEEVSSETVLKWNPEWIFTGADPGQENELRAQLMANPAIALTRAARDGHILVFDNRTFLPVSPYSAKLVTAMAQALYGGPRANEGGL
jgi:cobalamin transport system substrate-binding protein